MFRKTHSYHFNSVTNPSRYFTSISYSLTKHKQRHHISCLNNSSISTINYATKNLRIWNEFTFERNSGKAFFYFTNTDAMKKDDPYATLGLTWGASVTEIKAAYKKLAVQYHPDLQQGKVSQKKAQETFQRIQRAYEILMNKNNDNHRDDLADEWSFRIWRDGDIIAQERTDVAGVVRKRPIKPAESKRSAWGVATIGHPSGKGNSVRRRDEYLGDGKPVGKTNGTVGTGRNKWVKPKKFKPWDPNSSFNLHRKKK